MGRRRCRCFRNSLRCVGGTFFLNTTLTPFKVGTWMRREVPQDGTSIVAISQSGIFAWTVKEITCFQNFSVLIGSRSYLQSTMTGTLALFYLCSKALKRSNKQFCWRFRCSTQCCLENRSSPRARKEVVSPATTSFSGASYSWSILGIILHGDASCCIYTTVNGHIHRSAP